LPLLVEPAWLEPRLADPGLRVIDGSWTLPALKRDARAEYAAAHIPGAVFLDLSTDLADAARRNTVAARRRSARSRTGWQRPPRGGVRRLGATRRADLRTLRYAGHANVSPSTAASALARRRPAGDAEVPAPARASRPRGPISRATRPTSCALRDGGPRSWTRAPAAPQNG
jgi:hypothetical protein